MDNGDQRRPAATSLFEDDFSSLANWRHEGGGQLSAEDGGMRLACIGSEQGGVGCHAFCRRDFPDGIRIRFELLVQESNGLVIAFIAMRGIGGEDLFELPARRGYFEEYVGAHSPLQSYHVSLSRYDDEGRHTGVSNWRRNPGLHLAGQGPDLCKDIRRPYRIVIEKKGGSCRLFVNEQFAHGFDDPGQLPGAIPSDGKIGFRAIGSKVIATVSQLRVERLDR